MGKGGGRKNTSLVSTGSNLAMMELAARTSRGILETFVSYLEIREQRLSLEAVLDAEVRKQELALVALQSRIEENLAFLRAQQKEDDASRKAILGVIDFLSEQASRYVRVHTSLLSEGRHVTDDAAFQTRLSDAGNSVAQLFERIAELSRQLGPRMYIGTE
jgi:hypothetical protein